MMTKEILKQALEALESDNPYIRQLAANALRNAFVQPVQEPVHGVQSNGRPSPLLTHMMHRRTALLQIDDPDRRALQAEGKHPAPCARHCEAKAFEIEIRFLKSMLYTAPPLPVQEPVAWVCMKGENHDIDFDQSEIDAIPIGTFLYTAQPVQEPVGYVYWVKGHAEGAIDVQTLKPGTPLYTSPAAQRKPLTDEEIDALANNNGTVDLVTWWRQLARATEAAHNIGGV